MMQRHRSMPPQHLLSTVTVLAIAVALVLVILALQSPTLGLQLRADTQGRLEVGALTRHSPNAHRIEPGTVISAILDSTGRPIPVDGEAVIEEPDVLPGYPRFNAFLARQERLAQVLHAPVVTIATGDGAQVQLRTAERHLGQLPAMLWLQLLFGAAGLLLGVGVWAFRPASIATRLYAITGVSYALSAYSASVYSTRELALGAPWFRILSATNHLGAILFAGAFFALLWHYPTRLGRFPASRVGLGVALAFWIADQLQIGSETMQYGILTLFLPSFFFAFRQWRASANRPAERAALKWFLLSLYMGTGLFAGAVIIPPVFGMAPLASQGIMLGTFLFMYAGIALSVLRYRLFDLERWWWNAWLWFLSGMAVVALDITFLSALQLAESAAAALALAVVGWLYFPVRQWLWRRLHREPGLAAQLPALATRTFSAASIEQLRSHWRAALVEALAPLEINTSSARTEQVSLLDDGQTMQVPNIDGSDSLILRFPGGGGRLFKREDLFLTEIMLALGRRASQAIAARERGAEEERQRIMRDLHDDLGAKLLALVYATDGREEQQLARSALQDMRDVLVALEAEPCPLSQALEEWESDIRGRAGALGIEFEWILVTPPQDMGLNARERTNIARILREALANAAAHGQPSKVTVHVNAALPELHLRISDDGRHTAAPAQWSMGRGRRTMLSRAQELGGGVTWSRNFDQGLTVADVRLKLGHAQGAPLAADAA